MSTAMILMLTSIAGAAPFAYITNTNNVDGGNTVSVIDTATNNITATVKGAGGLGVAVSPDGQNIYVTNSGFSNSGGTVSVINTTTNSVTATVNGFFFPSGIAISPDGSKLYVTSYGGTTVSVINTTTNSIAATVDVGLAPMGVAITPDGKKVYVANLQNNNVSVINTTTNSVTATVNVGNAPAAFGQFIGKPAPTITWSNPADIVYGTALSSKQLDATSSVPGSFSYNPAAGTVLSRGIHTLSVSFTPTDTTDYTGASASVSINVR